MTACSNSSARTCAGVCATRTPVARYGGDEFLVRLHAHDGDAHAVARRLLDTWVEAGDVPTFSVGIAGHKPGADPKDTFAEADRALYVSKREGRARIAVA